MEQKKIKQRTFLPLSSIYMYVVFQTFKYTVSCCSGFYDFLSPIHKLKYQTNIDLKRSRLHKRKALLTEAARLQFTSRSNKAAITRELSRKNTHGSFKVESCFFLVLAPLFYYIFSWGFRESSTTVIQLKWKMPKNCLMILKAFLNSL